MYEDKPPFHWQDRADRTVVLHCRKILPNDRGDKGFQCLSAAFFCWLRLLNIQLQARLRPAIAVKAGVDFLNPGHGITAWNIRAFREEGQSLLFQLSIQISDDLRQSTFSVNKMFAGIFQKQRQGCSLFGVDQLFHIAEIHFGFSKRKAIFAVNLGFQSFRLSGTAVAEPLWPWS